MRSSLLFSQLILQQQLEKMEVAIHSMQMGKKSQFYMHVFLVCTFICANSASLLKVSEKSLSLKLLFTGTTVIALIIEPEGSNAMKELAPI